MSHSAAPVVSSAPPLSGGAWAWAAYQGGRDPYIVLISIYVFMPYVATVMIGDAVRGQAMIAGYATLGGLIAALTAPLLGASADRLGPRRPLMILLALLFAPMVFALWWARPDGSGLSVSTVLTLTLLISLMFTYSEVLHNSQLPYAARSAHDAAGASGLALALGSGVSVLVLAFVLWAFALPGQAPWAWLPDKPLFGLNPAQQETARIVAPIVAALFALGFVPYALFTPDAPRPQARGVMTAIGGGLKDLVGLVGNVRGHRDAALFLGARMLFCDAQIALITFSGVYAAGVMRWGVLDLLAFGVVLSVFAAIGGLAAAVLDRRFGSKRAVQIEIVAIVAGMTAILGITPDHLFGVAVDPNADPVWNGPVFNSVPELVYLAFSGLVAVFNTAAFSSSRTLLTRLTPPGRSGAFFGLYALSGTATAWLGPLMVQTATVVFRSQQAGTAAILALMVAGFLVLALVRGGERTEA